jgi:poly(3-hydroxybutyrate) depolymerase
MPLPWLAAWLLAGCGAEPEQLPAPALPGSIAQGSVSVSGISSGGALAQQLQLAHTDLFTGAGILAAPPFACAEGQLKHALGRCLDPGPEGLPVDHFAELLRAAQADGRADSAAGLAGDRVWLFHGTQDEAIARPVMNATAEFYAGLLPPGQLRYVTEVPAAHVFPVLDGPHACAAFEFPYLGDCDYDAAGELLNFLYPGLVAPAEDVPAVGADALQPTTLTGADEAGLESRAWLYLPPECPVDGCRLHLVLHGCGQAEGQVDQAFMLGSGYLPWARANGIVLAFPQVSPSLTNPLACWDWWGYTGDEYLWKEGAQARVLVEWLRSLGA